MPARRSPALRLSPLPILTALAGVLALALLPGMHADGTRNAGRLELSASATNPVTPGDIRGYGFDQCTAPSQKAMSTWMRTSPFLAVGIYISGNSRGCRSQPNLTKAWVHNQLAAGWRLLPITLGPQASCNPRYPRYKDDPTISPKPGKQGLYGTARNQARAEVKKTVNAATRLGITKGSTLWYDLEAFNTKNKACRESALAFLSAYTDALHRFGFVSGVYSSAGSGIVALDDARRARPSAYTLPDRLWIARWDGKANTSTTYIPGSAWNAHRRIKQYQGGHHETWGGVTIDIDRDFLDLGRGAWAPQQRPCGGLTLDFLTFPTLAPGTASKQHPALVKAVQCMLKQRGTYQGAVNGQWNQATINGLHQWKSHHGFGTADHGKLTRRVWVAFLSAGKTPILKIGSADLAVRRLQRALNANYPRRHLRVSGIYDSGTAACVRTYQKDHGQRQTGIVVAGTWKLLQKGAA